MPQKRRPAGFVLLRAFAESPGYLRNPSELTAEDHQQRNVADLAGPVRFMTRRRGKRLDRAPAAKQFNFHARQLKTENRHFYSCRRPGHAAARKKRNR